jgi:hypothetical protein
LYSDIKAEAKELGGKYTCSLYVLVLEKDNRYIANIRLTGAGFSAWMDFKDDIEDIHAIGVTFAGKSKQQKKGSVKYYEPTFTVIEADKITDEINTEADEADEKVQTYFDKLATQVTTTSKEDEEVVTEAQEATKLQGSTMIEEEEPKVDVDDLPF